MIRAVIALAMLATPLRATVTQRSRNVSSNIVDGTVGKFLPGTVALANVSAHGPAGGEPAAAPAASPAASPASVAAEINKHTELARESAAEAAEHLKTAKKALNITMGNMNTTNATVKEIHQVAKDVKHLYTPPNGTKPLEAGATRWHLPWVAMELVIACTIHLQ